MAARMWFLYDSLVKLYCNADCSQWIHNFTPMSCMYACAVSVCVRARVRVCGCLRVVAVKSNIYTPQKKNHSCTARMVFWVCINALNHNMDEYEYGLRDVWCVHAVFGKLLCLISSAVSGLRHLLGDLIWSPRAQKKVQKGRQDYLG